MLENPVTVSLVFSAMMSDTLISGLCISFKTLGVSKFYEGIKYIIIDFSRRCRCDRYIKAACAGVWTIRYERCCIVRMLKDNFVEDARYQLL